MSRVPPTPARPVRRGLVLGLGLNAQSSCALFLNGLPMLLPELRAQHHLSLAAASWVIAAPTFGLLATLIAWGAAADRYGERSVMATGLALAGGLLVAASFSTGVAAQAVLLALAGAAGASVNAASGRVVLGWYAAHERGLAMGVRQTALPLGVGAAALVLPPIANAAGLAWALRAPAGLCLLAAVLVAAFVVDPPRPPRPAGGRAPSPYRQRLLWLVHGSSALLVVPQFAVAAFALEYLVARRHWGAAEAGQLLFAFQILGGAGRLAAGWWSDRVGSRLGPMRQVAVASAAGMLAVALGDLTGSVLVVAALGAAAVITVADNGLGFTAAAEAAGNAWAGRALGAHNTAQNVAAALTPPLLGALIGLHGYAIGFAVAAAFPLAAIAVTPVAAEAAHRVPA